MKPTATFTIGQVKAHATVLGDAQAMLIAKFGHTPETLRMCRALQQVNDVLTAPAAFDTAPNGIHPAGGTNKA